MLGKKFSQRKWLIETSLLVVLATGLMSCGAVDAKKREVTNKAMVLGVPSSIIAKVVQWCAENHCTIEKHGDAFLIAEIDAFMWQNNGGILQNERAFDCGIAPIGDPNQLFGGKMTVSVDVGFGASAAAEITVALSGRSVNGQCYSTGFLEAKLFDYLDATPIKK